LKSFLKFEETVVIKLEGQEVARHNNVVKLPKLVATWPELVVEPIPLLESLPKEPEPKVTVENSDTESEHNNEPTVEIPMEEGAHSSFCFDSFRFSSSR